MSDDSAGSRDRSTVATVVDAALELPIAPSFTRVGYDVRSRLEHWDDGDWDLTGRVVVLTGATSGLGLAATGRLAELGATVVLVGRDARRTASVRDDIAARTANDHLEVLDADMGDLDAVRAACDELARRHDHLDALVHNAGALSDTRELSPQGIEATVASQVVGPFLMTALLLDQLAAQPDGDAGRVVTMSSGGMYAAPLCIANLEMSPAEYGGSEQYARAKRAQVTLNEMWAERVDPADTVFQALHPGWAATPGVERALPTFNRVLGPLLRSPEQGSDTLVWLVADDEALERSGEFWLDRSTRPIHRLPTTRRSDTPERRARLWEHIVELSGVDRELPG